MTDWLEAETDWVGRRVLVGLTFLHPDESFDRQEQMFGRIVSMDRSNGVEVALEGQRVGETFWLPPDLRPFSEAAPGEYRLRSTGETVVDPDLLATWTITAPART
ncbi:MAG TPA: hypothetical protein VF686_09250 [Brevundimonas sp.]